MTTQREMKERLIDARYQAEKEVSRLKDELREVKRDAQDVAIHNLELMEENKKLKEELDKANKLADKLNEQVRVLIFEREIRLATMREMRKKMRDMIK